MSLLSICQAVTGELGLSVPTFMLSNSEQIAQQMVALSQSIGNQLVKEFAWPTLLRTNTYVLISGQEAYSMPPDYDRQVTRTSWDQLNHWEMLGPESPQEWNWRHHGIVASSPRRRFRLMLTSKPLPAGTGLYFLVDPIPSSTGAQVSFEYVSKNWILGADKGSTFTTWQNDNDTSLIDETLMISALLWRFQRAKGLDYDEEYARYTSLKSTIYAQQVGQANRSLGNRQGRVVGLSPYNIPESGYGS